jgi:putative acetyltransferase
MYRIDRAIFPKDLEVVLDLYREYIESTTVDLSFQNNASDFEYLAEKYSDDHSQIFLLWKEDKPVGCAAFRKVDDNVCEMKRVYIRPIARGDKQGALLVERVLMEAASAGFEKMCLDVLPEFKKALALYRSFGFSDHEPITNNPIAGTQFLGLDLEPFHRERCPS